MLNATQLREHFAGKGFARQALREMGGVGLRALYKREEEGATPDKLTPEEFFALYVSVLVKNNGDEPRVSLEDLKNGVNGYATAPISQPSSQWAYSQRYRPGDEILLVPRAYTSTTGMFPINKTFIPRPEEIKTITKEVYVPFSGRDDVDGIAFPHGIDFVKLFNVGMRYRS